MIVRNPLPEEIPAILKQTDEIFAEQDIPAELLVFAPGQNPVWYAGYEDGELVGAIATFEENGETHLGRFTVAHKFQGRHMGTEIMLSAIEGAFASGVEKLVGEARDTSIHILCKHGGRTTGETYTFYIGNATPFEICKKDYHRD